MPGMQILDSVENKTKRADMNDQKILVTGASIAGPTLAYWLNRYGFQVTVAERAPELRLGAHVVSHVPSTPSALSWRVRPRDTQDLL